MHIANLLYFTFFFCISAQRFSRTARPATVAATDQRLRETNQIPALSRRAEMYQHVARDLDLDPLEVYLLHRRYLEKRGGTKRKATDEPQRQNSQPDSKKPKPLPSLPPEVVRNIALKNVPHIRKLAQNPNSKPRPALTGYNLPYKATTVNPKLRDELKRVTTNQAAFVGNFGKGPKR